MMRRSSFPTIENEQYEVELSRAARKIAQNACAAADQAHVFLTAATWHRGHEVADSDNWWLTLTSARHGVTERFPIEWLIAYGGSNSDSPVVRQVAGMVKALGSARDRV
jgi:hypothetical protein